MPGMKMGLSTSRCTRIPLIGIILGLELLLFPLFPSPVYTFENWTGSRIMDEVFKRHELFPYVFEEQTMIMMDHAGNRDVRKARRFSRVEKDGTVRYLLVFDHPAEIRGVALLATRHHTGVVESGVYLPAFGKELKSNAGKSRGIHFLGTDFAIEDLTAEILSDFHYVRVADSTIKKTVCFVVEALPKDEEIERTTGYSLRRHYIQQDNFFILRTDYYDRRGRFSKSLTNHDLKRVDGDMWRANMILMANLKERHKTLIKIDRRIFSHDYVPPEIFTAAWLLKNRHVRNSERRLLHDGSRSSEKKDNGLLGDNTNNNPQVKPGS